MTSQQGRTMSTNTQTMWRHTFVAMGLALAYLECELRSSVTPGDHEILFVEVVGGKVLQAEDKPLAHVRKSGLGY